jgi:hypothetical protein
MTFPRFIAALQAGDLIIVRGGGNAPLHVPAYLQRLGRPDVRRGEPRMLRKRLGALIAFRKERRKK